MQAIGYKEAAAALRGECSRAEAVETIKRETRRYAKRQLTWLRRREGALRIDWQGEPILRPPSGIRQNICSAAVYDSRVQGAVRAAFCTNLLFYGAAKYDIM